MQAKITSITGLQNLINLQTFIADNNSLTTVDLSGLTNLTYVNLQNNDLTETSVNNILQWLDGNGELNGNVDLSGGTSAVPSGAGITAKDNLLAKGWSVNVNG
jgi:Leucine-rich repeat (LRR) protein